MNIVSVCVVGIFAVICSASLRKSCPEAASLLPISAAVTAALFMLPYAQSVISEITSFSDKAMINEAHLKALIKAVGITILTRTTADICRENGSQSVASQVELCGRLSILITALPLYGELVRTAAEFI